MKTVFNYFDSSSPHFPKLARHVKFIGFFMAVVIPPMIYRSQIRSMEVR